MQLTIEKIAVLLLIAGVIAMVARRLRVPYSVGLVLAGVASALIPFAPEIQLTKELIFTVLLPPLIFEAAFYLHWKDLRKELSLILTLATLGVVISAAATALGMHLLADWEWESALIFGIFISATDPVSVIAAFKDAGARGRIKLLVEAESLFNDGTAAVAFSVAVAMAAGQSVGVFAVGLTLILTIGGALLCGAVVAGTALLLMWRTNDHLVEITFTTITAYGSFLLAEHFHFSGVLATLTAGLMVGGIGRLKVMSEEARQAVETFWEFAAFVANSLIFLLVGMRVAHQNFVAVWAPAAIAILLVTFSRALAIYPCCAIFFRSSLRVEKKHQHVLFWGGLRGALALALALGLPDSIPRREEIVTVAFAVVAFSIFVQGLTISPFMKRMGALSTKS